MALAPRLRRSISPTSLKRNSSGPTARLWRKPPFSAKKIVWRCALRRLLRETKGWLCRAHADSEKLQTRRVNPNTLQPHSPSACGKTNLLCWFLQFRAGLFETIGDDIAWMKNPARMGKFPRHQSRSRFLRRCSQAPRRIPIRTPCAPLRKIPSSQNVAFD